MRQPAVRLVCGVLAVMAGLFAARVLWTGELATRGGTARLGRVETLMVSGVLVALAAGSGWVAATGRGGE